MLIWIFIAVTGYYLQHIFREMLTLDEASVLFTDYIDQLYGKVVELCEFSLIVLSPYTERISLNTGGIVTWMTLRKGQ